MKISDYFKPKSLVYTGEFIEQKTKVRRFIYGKEKLEILDDIKKADEKQYIQVVGLNDLEKIKEIAALLAIEPFVIEDILNVKQRNKIERVGDLVFSSFSLMYQEQGSIKKDYLSMVLKEDVLVTFHEKEPLYLLPLEVLLEEYQELKKNGSDFLFYQILDLITDDHLDVYDTFEENMRQFEEEILETKKSNQEDFYVLRKNVLQLKNKTNPLYEHLTELLKAPTPLITKETMTYFQDLLDHMKRLDLKLDQLRDLMKTLLDLDLNNQSTRMNKIMSTLTLFSAIFIPLSFLTGFFGMNFVHFDVLSFEYAVIVFTGLCVFIAVMMLYIFKKHRWF